MKFKGWATLDFEGLRFIYGLHNENHVKHQ